MSYSYTQSGCPTFQHEVIRQSDTLGGHRLRESGGYKEPGCKLRGHIANYWEHALARNFAELFDKGISVLVRSKSR